MFFFNAVDTASKANPTSVQDPLVNERNQSDTFIGQAGNKTSESNAVENDNEEVVEVVADASIVPTSEDSQGNGDKASKTQRALYNDFQPFHRLPNLPFTISGRPRAMSVDTCSDHFDTSFEPAIAAIAHIPSIDQQIVKPAQPKQRRNSCMAMPSLETIMEEGLDGVVCDIRHLYI